jgi:hypothetical protein
MRVPRGVDGENGEVGEEVGHWGGSGTRGEEQMLRKTFWPSSSSVLTVNLQKNKERREKILFNLRGY